MDAFLIPVAEPGFEFGLALTLLALQLLQQQAELLSKAMEAFPPMRAAVLVTIADKELVE